MYLLFSEPSAIVCKISVIRILTIIGICNNVSIITSTASGLTTESVDEKAENNTDDDFRDGKMVLVFVFVFILALGLYGRLVFGSEGSLKFPFNKPKRIRIPHPACALENIFVLIIASTNKI